MSKQTTLQRAQNVASQLEALLTSCASEKKRSVILKSFTEVKQQTGALLEHLLKNEKRKCIGVRKSFMAVANVLDGTIEGLSSKDMGLKDFRGVLNRLNTKFYPDVCTSLSVEIERERELAATPAITLNDDQKDLKEALASSSDLKEALTAIRTAIKTPDATSEQTTDKPSDTALGKQLKALQEKRNILPVKLKGQFQLFRLPIVPIFSNYRMNNPDTFNKLGIKHLSVEHYAILLDQVLVAVSAKVAARHELTSLQYAESVVSLINERGTTEYDFVSDQHVGNPRNADIHLFWLLTRQRMHVLTKVALSGRTANTVKWGFPF